MRQTQDDTQRGELRTWLARRLRLEELPWPLWEWLEEEGDVDEVLDSNRPLDREDLLGMVKERLRFAKEMAPFVGTSTTRVPADQPLGRDVVGGKFRQVRREQLLYDPLLDPLAERMEQLLEAGAPVDPRYQSLVGDLLNRRQGQRELQIAVDLANGPVTQRAEAFSLYLAKLANEDAKVKDFRRQVLGEHTVLSEEVAVAFISSPAIAIFPAAWFRKHGVPITRHIAKVTELERLSPRWPHRLRGTLEVAWDSGQITSPFTGAALASDLFNRGTVGAYALSALKGSVIADLLLVDDHLMSRFPWRPLHRDVLQVPMFVLTGKVPWVEPIRATVPRGYPDLYQTVDITAWPWVPTEEVTSVYERVRKELNPTPITSPKRLALFIFVMRHPEVEVPREGEKPKVPSWRELLRLWNEEHPEGKKWHYKDVRNFQRDFKEAFEALVNFYRSGVWFTREHTDLGLEFDFGGASI
jgi:hypothetical protein